jgi:hypothetical protein
MMLKSVLMIGHKLIIIIIASFLDIWIIIIYEIEENRENNKSIKAIS